MAPIYLSWVWKNLEELLGSEKMVNKSSVSSTDIGTAHYIRPGYVVNELVQLGDSKYIHNAAL